jgi:hypothetical protein
MPATPGPARPAAEPGRRTSIYLTPQDVRRLAALGEPKLADVMRAGLEALEQGTTGQNRVLVLRPDGTYEWRDETRLAAQKHAAVLAAQAMRAHQE